MAARSTTTSGINGGAATKINVLGTYDVKTKGTTTISYQAVDAAGSPSGWSAQVPVCVS